MKKLAIFTDIIFFISPHAQSEVTITLDKIDKHIEFTVCNHEERKQVKYIGVSVEKKDNERWRLVRSHADCPCEAKCKRVVIELELDECKRHSWDKKKKNSMCKTVENGAYRFIVSGDWNPKSGAINILGKSREFKLH